MQCRRIHGEESGTAPEKGGMNMGLFDRLYSAASAELPAKKSVAGLRVERFSFAALPESLEEMRALPEADLVDPFKTAALTVCALCAYAADRAVGTELHSGQTVYRERVQRPQFRRGAGVYAAAHSLRRLGYSASRQAAHEGGRKVVPVGAAPPAGYHRRCV